MEADETGAEATPEPLNPIAHLHTAIQECVDDGSMCVGYALVAEWIEADGTQCVSVMHTPMPPWHLDGLLSYAKEWSSPAAMVPVAYDADDEDDDFYE